MSLNGLDDATIVEAYEAASAEAGGWFLLKYTSRDEVDILSRGNGGITDVRSSIEAYQEESPLYGFLKYRRRNVIIKYLPEDCSRLIQARVAVHFNAVCERFSPYDTIFEIATADRLTDHKLSAACSLHTASGSTSSTGSLRKKRLVEIAEEEEDDTPPSKRKSMIQDLLEPPKSPASPSWNTDPVTLNADLASSPEQSKFSAAATSDVPTFVGIEDRPSTADSFSAADAAQDFGYLGYPYSKPKIKLGPRPSIDSAGRPQTAGNFRPVSAIPAGYKLFGKGRRTKSKDSSVSSSPLEESPAPDFSDTAEDLLRPTSSDSSQLKSMTEGVVATTSTKKTITPEKARLMKAMKLRQKKKQQQAAAVAVAAAEQASSPTALDDATTESTAGLENPEEEETEVEGEVEAEAEAETEVADVSTDDSQLPVSAADSGIVMDVMSSSVHTEASDLASEPDESTNASSVSESTDETAKANDEIPVQTNKVEAILPATTATAELQKEPLPVLTVQTNSTPETNSTGDADEADDQPLALPISKFSPNGSQHEPTAAALEDTSSANEIEKKKLETVKADLPPMPVPASPQDVLAATKAASQQCVVTPAIELAESPLILSVSDTTTSTTTQAEAKQQLDDSDTETIPAQAEQQQQQQKQKVDVPPIQTDVEAVAPIAAVTADDAAEENASAEAAKKSSLDTPVTPIDGANFVVRTLSNPVRGNFVANNEVTASSARSVSTGAAYLHKITQQQAGNNLSLKASVGSSISQRIKALEMLSATNVAEAARPGSRERPQSTFFSVKKREPSRSPSVLERTNSLRQTATPSPGESQQDTSSPDTARPPARDRSGSMANRLSMFQPVPDSMLPGGGGNETISVTAKIVRDPGNPMHVDASQDPANFNPLDLKQSPLFVSHQKGSFQEPKVTAVETTIEQSTSQESFKDDKSRRSSLSIVRGFMKDRQKSPTIGPDESAPGFPAGVGRSPSQRPSISTQSSYNRDRDINGDESRSPGGGDGKMSRAGRFMKRLSTLSSSSRGTKPLTNNTTTTLAPVVAAETEVKSVSNNAAAPTGSSRPSTTGTSPWITSYLGDVNVQFPDSLLWKRRNMCVDSQGFLVLSALPAQSSRAAQGTKRFHLSEFRPPYTPEVEMQELPNSVVLDFVEGTSLQLACEDRAGQVEVLDALREAHGKHAEAFGK